MARNNNKEPGPIYGKGDFANLPEKPIFKDFPKDPTTRGGIPDSFTANLEEVTGICENKQEKY